MTYSQQTWVDGQVGGTPISATRLNHMEDGIAAAATGGSTTPPNTADATRYVSGTGSDANDGLTAATPKLTIQAAYTSLPSTGGTLWVAPGRYNVGAGLVISRGKPVQLLGTVKPPPYINSTTTAPLSVNAAILYSSTGAASLVTTTGGTAANRLDGLVFKHLVFELSQSTTLTAIRADTTNFGRVEGCQFFADKTSSSPGPAPVTAVGVRVFVTTPGTYGGDDASWWRIVDNSCMNMALCVLGNDSGTKYSANQHIVRDNIGLGLTHTNTSCLPFISIYGGHRCVVRDNNVEAYNRAVLMDTCWDCVEDSDGGEFVDVFVDLVNCKGLRISPIGIAYAGLGNNSSTSPILQDAKLVRGDSSTKACVLILFDTWTQANTQRLAQPTDDSLHPAVAMSATDNVIIASRNMTNQGLRELFGTGSPEGVITGIVGDIYRRSDGGVGSTFYLKESGTGNTGWQAHGAPSAALPTQTGNSGRYLTTDGTAASWGTPPGSPITIVSKAADASSITSSTTLVSDPDLIIAISGNSTDIWFFEAMLLVNTANATMDIKIGFSWPTGVTMLWNALNSGSTTFGLGPQTTATTPPALTNQSTTQSFGTAAANTVPITVAGWVFDGGTAGTFAVQYAQATSDAGALVVKKGSFMKVSKVH